MKRNLLALFLITLLPSFGVAQERVKFPVGVSSKVLGYGHLWAAWRLKYFEREGLDVDVVLMRGTAPAVQAMIAGSISAALVANDGPIAAVEQGMDIVMVASSSKLTHMLIGGKNYKTWEDLRGSTIGSSTLTSGTAFVLRRALKMKGLEYPRDYKLLNVGGTTSAFAAMSAGQISAAMLAVPNAFQAQDAGFNLIGRVADIFPNYLLSAYSVRRSFAEKNRPLVVRFLKAVVRAKKWFEQDRKAATEFLAKEFQLPPSLAEKGLDYYLTNQAWHPELEIEMDGLRTVVDIYAEQTGMKGAIPSPEKYVDQSYLRQALKELGLR
ncbi:MAG: ABC transporter substrate-binding protein [Deltaproteobacteria bacterium]|nr:MAG: ABC transporter substrate-binding protein [Deltaproteobacteria bacterium]